MRYDLPQRDLVEELRAGMDVETMASLHKVGKRTIFTNLLEAYRMRWATDDDLAPLRLEHEVVNWPEDSDARLKSVLGIINNEIQQILFFLSDKHTLKSPKGMYQLLKNAVGKEDLLPHPTTVTAYYNHAFKNNPLFVHDVFDYKQMPSISKNHYRLSDAGMKYAKMIAAYSIMWAFNNKKSIYSILGGGGSTKNESAFNRARVIEEIEMGSNRITDISDTLGLAHSSVTGHVKALEDLDFLEYIRLDDGSGYPRTWVGDYPKELGVTTPSFYDVAKWLYVNETGTPKQIADATGLHRTSIKRALSYLKKNGYITSHFDGEKRSDIIPHKTLDPVVEYIATIRALLDGNGTAGRIMRDATRELEKRKKEVFQTVVGLYNEVSVGMNSIPLEQRELEFLNWIRSYQEINEGKEPGSSQIGARFKLVEPSRVLLGLVKAGYLESSNEGNAKTYGITGKGIERIF